MKRICIERMRLIPAVAILAALALPAAAQQASIAIGPYVQNVGKDCATICWETPCEDIAYEPASLDRKTAVRGYQHHELTLRYLQPGTTYTYDVLRDGSDAGKGAFTTLPEGEHPFSFVTLADCHNYLCEPIVKQVMKDKPDMVFLPGDLVYDGLVMFHWEDWSRVNRELMRSVPYYPALGNHELDSPLYFRFFALPGNERYYSFNRGAAHFVVLDSFGPRMRDVYWHDDEMATNQPVTKHQLEVFRQYHEQYWQDQLAWLKDDLGANQNAKHIFVFFHHPMYTSHARGLEAAKRMRARFGSIFQDYRVSAVFNGHDHHYNHALVGGVHFIMTCAGGEPIGADAPQPETMKTHKPHNYARVDVGPSSAHVRAADIEGKQIEEFDIAPRASAVSAGSAVAK